MKRTLTATLNILQLLQNTCMTLKVEHGTEKVVGAGDAGEWRIRIKEEDFHSSESATDSGSKEEKFPHN